MTWKVNQLYDYGKPALPPKSYKPINIIWSMKTSLIGFSIPKVWVVFCGAQTIPKRAIDRKRITATTLKENLQMTLLKTLHSLHTFTWSQWTCWSDHTIKYQRPTFPLSPPLAFLSRQNTKINEVGLFGLYWQKMTIFRGRIKEWKPESVTLCFLFIARAIETTF